jgi:hypothetical protein
VVAALSKPTFGQQQGVIFQALAQQAAKPLLMLRAIVFSNPLPDL